MPSSSRLLRFRSLAALALSILFAAPAFAGTVYVPILAPQKPADASFQTRIWLTNHGAQAATVTTVRMVGIVDGTKTRQAPVKHAIAAGTTKVLTPGKASGLLEIRAPATVAIGAELRNAALPGPLEVYGGVPVVGSSNLAEPGQTLVLQGLRRSADGVRTHLGLINLGHQAADCDVEIRGAGGATLGKAKGLTVPALSHVPIEDVLELVDVTQAGDANAAVSCSRRFYAYLASVETATGEAVFHTPSATGASTLAPPAATPADDGAGNGGGGGGGNTGGGKSFVYQKSGVIHTPTPQHPTWTHDIQMPPNTDFRKVIVEVDFTVGNWDAKEPNKAHSIFWLHRGGRWPVWADNMIGYANAYGPGANKVKVKHNMNVKSRPYPFAGGEAKLQKGKTYHIRYEYDAAGGTISMRLSQGGKLLSSGTSKAKVKKIRSDSTGLFMLYFGHEKHKGAGQAGPEKPTYGWKYANARVEFVKF